MRWQIFAGLPALVALLWRAHRRDPDTRWTQEALWLIGDVVRLLRHLAAEGDTDATQRAKALACLLIEHYRPAAAVVPSRD